MSTKKQGPSSSFSRAVFSRSLPFLVGLTTLGAGISVWYTHVIFGPATGHAGQLLDKASVAVPMLMGLVAGLAVRVLQKSKASRRELARDVSARLEAEEALRRSQAALKFMVDNAPFGICSTSLKRDCFVEFNPATVEMLGGYTREEMLALRLSTQVYADSNDRNRMLEEVQRCHKVNAFEFTVVRKDGKRIRVRSWGVLRSKSGEEPDVLDCYVVDVTEQSTLEQQVRQVQKLEAVGRLAGGIAHDFNNILVVIRLSTELMLGKVALDNPLSKPLLQVLTAADRAAALTRQLLAFGRQQMMQSRIVNLNTLVTDTLKLLRRTIGEDIDLVTYLDDDLQNTRLDPDQLAQVIMNLAINARDAMPRGGTLTIETRNVTLDETYSKDHGPVLPGSYVMLVVTDTGCGMDKAILPRIFDPFFTTKEIGKGTGLGLSIVYGIVKQSGGYIWVYSEPEHGTSFKLYFPVTDAVEEIAPERGEVPPVGVGKTLLVVEDEAQIRHNLRECLQHLGYRVFEAVDGVDALDVFSAHQGEIDLVVTDLVMPRMGGHELSARLMGMDPSLSVLFLSGYTEHTAARREILSKGSAFLTKPFSVADLSEAVHHALSARAPSSTETVTPA
jgi:PAS domain S-box-containing protein